MKLQHQILQRLSPVVPAALRRALRTGFSFKEFDHARCRAANPYYGKPDESFPTSRFLFGIIEEITQYHKYYIAACRDLKVSYRLLSLMADDWLPKFRNSGCDAFLAWPSSDDTAFKSVFDYRLQILEYDLGRRLFPTWRECWLTEHKPRLRDWMDAYGIPHPKTWVFYSREAALAFAADADLPIVFKTATGGSASGIRIVRSRSELKQAIREAFGRGLCPYGYDPHDRQRGFAFLQEYLPDVQEWRMVRIGDSFFGYRKEKGPSGLHSASHTWSWLDPGPDLLNLLKRVTDSGDFTSMDVDVFRTTDGRLLVNECQTVFGCSTPAIQMKVSDVEGRYVWTKQGWRFERGEFCQNHMCNLRVKYLISVLEHDRRPPTMVESSQEGRYPLRQEF